MKALNLQRVKNRNIVFKQIHLQWQGRVKRRDITTKMVKRNLNCNQIMEGMGSNQDNWMQAAFQKQHLLGSGPGRLEENLHVMDI